MTDAIETSRLLLVPFKERHVLALSQAVNNFRIIQNTARIPWPYRLDDASAFWRFTVGRQGRSPCFCIFAKDRRDVLAGGISYDLNATGSEAEIGYWVAEPCWGRGYGLTGWSPDTGMATRLHAAFSTGWAFASLDTARAIRRGPAEPCRPPALNLRAANGCAPVRPRAT